MIHRKLIGIVGLMLATALVAVMGITSCSSSGGDNGGTTAPASASAVSIGAMTKGSVIVNGVEFDDTTATVIADDDAQKVLANGMVVKVKGTVNDDGLAGKAEKVEVVNEVSGKITLKNADTFSVLSQTVLVDGGTVFAGGATNLAGLNQNDSVEVHGQRMADAARTIHATRVEKHAGGVVDEVRGAVSGKAATTFNIGSLPITFGISTAITPTGATFADGDIVQVHLSGTTATSIKVEDNDVEFEPAEGQHFEVEGFVSGLSSGSFTIDDQQVQTTSGTRFEGGVEGDLVNDMKVEAEGHLANGILVANKIAFKDTVRIEANAETNGSVNLLGKTVLITSKTELSSNFTGTSDIVAGTDSLRIRGFVNNDGSSITATRVDKQGLLSNNRSIVRGPVKNISSSGRTFTILGITINAGSSTARPNDDSGSSSQSMTLDSFFTSLTADRTIVKARGAFDAGTNTISADEIEIE